MQSEGQFSTRIYVNNSKSPMAVDEPIYSNFKPQSEVRVDVESSDSELSSEPPRSTQIPILPPPIKPRTSLLKKKAAAAAAVAATQAASAVAAAVSSQNASSGLTFHLEQFSENQNNVRLNNASSEAIIADQFDETYDEPVRQMQPPNFPPPPPPLQSCGQTYEDLDRIPSVSTCRNSAPLHHYHKPQSVSSSNDAPDVDSEAEESDRSDCQTPYELEDLSEQSSRRSSHRLTRIDAQLQKQLQQLDQKLNELTVEESLLGDEPIYGRILPQSPKSNDGATSSEGSPPTAAPIPPPIPPRSVAMLAHRPRLAYPISDGMNGSIASSTTEHHHSSSSSGVDLNRSSSSCSSSSSSKPPNSWTKGSKRSHRPMIGIISPLVRSLSRSSFSLDRKGKSNGTTPKSFDSSKTVTGGDDSTALIESNRKMSTTSGVVAVGRLQDENGYLFKTGPARKQFYRRWCTLDAYALCYYNEPPPADKIATVSPNGRLQLNDVLFVGQSAQTVWMHKSRLARAFRSMRSSATTTTASVASLNSSSFVASANGGGLTSTGINASSLASSLSISCDSDNSIELHAFNVGVCGESGRTYLFAGDSDATRRRWLNAIAVRIRPMLRPASISYDAVDACGYVNLKLGVSGLWTRCWAVLKQRWLCLQLLDVPDGASDAEQLLAIDLRKVMHVSPAPSAPVEPCEAALETGQPFVLVRHAEHSLYVQADFRSHTSHWLTLMQTHWTLPENGLMELQLLSSGDVPLAVEKCLNFICTYGGLATKSLYAPDDEQSSANESSASDAGSVLTIFNHLKGGSSLFEWHLKPEDGFTVFDVTKSISFVVFIIIN